MERNKHNKRYNMLLTVKPDQSADVLLSSLWKRTGKESYLRGMGICPDPGSVCCIRNEF